MEHNLAWHSIHSQAYGWRTWYALHPTLGSAIMTVLGLSIAREHKYDIVTPSEEFHETLLATKEGAIFETLLAPEENKPIPTAEQVRHDLSHLVIALTGVNLQALQPEDIPELQASKHLRAFQRLIRTRAQTIERDDDANQYQLQLTSEADEIIQAWQDTKTELRSKCKALLFDAALTLSPEVLRQLLKGPNVIDLAISGGVAILRTIRKGLHRRTGPYQYLTEVKRAPDPFLCMSFPLGLER
jgi:hypothetical protein